VSGSYCHIDALVVDKPYRGKGIGRKLIKVAEGSAISKECVTFDLIMANWRRDGGSHAFYQALGYKDHNQGDYTYFYKEQNLISS